MDLQPRILVAEDDVDVRGALVDCLRQGGNDVVDVPDGDHVREYIDECMLYDVPHKRGG